jgi:hypothetical protein
VDEASRIAANIAKLPELIEKKETARPYVIHPISRAFILAASHAMARKSLELIGASGSAEAKSAIVNHGEAPLQ